MIDVLNVFVVYFYHFISIHGSSSMINFSGGVKMLMQRNEEKKPDKMVFVILIIFVLKVVDC